MPVRVPLKIPFQSRTEVAMIWATLVTCVVLSLSLWTLGLRRADLILRIPPTEADAKYLVRELYEETSPVDIAFIGNCTLWWHVYTPNVQTAATEVFGRPANVITVGFNHFGSDVVYLLAKDLIERRQVKNIVLSLPKIEDFNEFPHRGAVNWWIYPHDLESFTELSAVSQIRLAGLTLFTSFRRFFFFLAGAPVIADEAQLRGFNAGRIRPGDPEKFLTSTDRSITGRTGTLNPQKVEASDLLSNDWMLYFQKISDLAKAHGTKIIFVDSPHGPEFESRENNVAWGFEKYFEASTVMIDMDFVDWYQKQPKDVQRNLVEGHNLTYWGALAYTQAITPALLKAAQR